MSTTIDSGDRALVQALEGLRATPPAGFTERVLARVGPTPALDEFVVVDGPSGPLFVAFGAEGIRHVIAADVVDRDPEAFVARHRERFGRSLRPASAPPAGLTRALESGRGRALRFDLHGLTEFEQAVLRKALEIPPGEVRPYAWIAREIGRPKAVRAVGSALGRNPVPVLIPCHRVVRNDGKIGHYAFGTAMKRDLLAHEHVDLDRLEELGRTRVRYLGSDTTSVYCFPTCRHARRITAAHRVPFRTAAEADAAGFRPCRDCRPEPARQTA